MGVIFRILLGGILGWIASLVFDIDPKLGIIGNVSAGVMGAFIGGLIAKSIMFSKGSFDGIVHSIFIFASAVLGALVLVGTLNLMF